ncbi:MAG: 30S ribosomal protein S6 [Candidatus Levybacteria bacterium]|nr:30S ribosomal protein S6 [Candidatus Levybacteria bacterium]
MRTYELVLVLRPSLTEAKLKKVLGTIKGWLKPASITKEDVWGAKPLAYKIKRETSGYYTVLHLKAEESLDTGIEKRLVTDEDVLRHLLIRRK